MEFKQQLFNIWTPQESGWSSFAKPVLFYSIEGSVQGVLPPMPISYIAAGTTDTAIILDVPGANAVQEGITLARLGFRPVPLFNGNSVSLGQIELVDTASIKTALCLGGLQLASIPLVSNAPPVFLLDSNRLLDKYAAPGMFDNRWNLYAHDLPSSDYFLRAGIKKIIVRNNDGHILADLAPILFNLQQAGIEILVQQSSGVWQNQNNQMDDFAFDGDYDSYYDNYSQNFGPIVHMHMPVRTRIRQPGLFSRLFGRKTYKTSCWNSTGGWGSSRPCHGYGGKFGGGYRGGYGGGGSC
ncbi:MAG: hypothetical protein FWC80_03720 [Firmicutes bacterium]|nr:hypothetical protein [Bacillota bacterium]